MTRNTRADKKKKSILILCLIAALILGICAGALLFTGKSRPQTDSKKAVKTQKEETGDAEKETKEKLSPQDLTADRADEILAQMSLQEKIDQMFLITPETLTGIGEVIQAGETTRKAIEEHPVGGIIYFSHNLQNREQTQQMIETTQSFSRYGLLIAVDEEGGQVARVADHLGTTQFSPMFSYRSQGAETARANAAVIAEDIKQFGFNTDFAPVADVWSNPANTVIGNRAYSDDFAQAAQLVPAAVEGFHQEDVICCLKHFPGHGDTNEDSHTSSAYSDKTYEEMAAQEWTVFRAGIDAGADMVMMGHVTATQLDDVPATVSQKLITQILRGDLGFKGVVITDSLQMGAVSQQYDAGTLAVRAVQAGVDMLLEPADFEMAESALLEAVQNGTVPESRIDESVQRILEMKIQHSIIK